MIRKVPSPYAGAFTGTNLARNYPKSTFRGEPISGLTWIRIRSHSLRELSSIIPLRLQRDPNTAVGVSPHWNFASTRNTANILSRWYAQLIFAREIRSNGGSYCPSIFPTEIDFNGTACAQALDLSFRPAAGNAGSRSIAPVWLCSSISAIAAVAPKLPSI